MSNETIKKTVADLKQRVENLERKNLPAQPTDEEIRMDAAQEAYEAAEVSFQTKHLGKMNVCLNSPMLTKAQILELLREKDKKKD